MYRIIARRVALGTSKQKFSQKHLKCIRHKSDKQNLCPPPVPKPGSGSGLIYTVGGLALISGGAVAYASYDPSFRCWLNDNVPYSDAFIKFALQEERSYVESFIALLESIKESFLTMLPSSGTKRGDNIKEVPKEYTPPAPAFSPLAKGKVDEKYVEIRIEELEPGQEEPSVKVGGDEKHPPDLDDTHPKKIEDLEAKMAVSAGDAIQTFNKAIYALKRYNADIESVVEDSVDQLDPGVWNSLRQNSKEKHDLVEKAQEHLNNTKKYADTLRTLLRNPKVCAPAPVKQQVEFNIKKVLGDIEKARKDLEVVQASSNISEKYWKKVEEGRNHFIDEIEILFPTVDIKEKKLELQGGELDLFILHAFANVLYYQKELNKLQLIVEEKVKTAMESARRGNPELLTEAQIQNIVDKEKSQLQSEFQKKCLCLRIDSERELRKQLKLQSETFNDHLAEALKTKEQEMERSFARQIDEKVSEERCRFKLQLSALSGRVKGMDDTLKARLETDKYSRQAQVLWSACQSLFRALKAGCPGLPWKEQLRPLESEILAVRQAAAKSDELVTLVLSNIPKEATDRGVFPEDALRERFINVEKAARQLALVPDGGARLPLHILSFLQSLLLLKSANPIPLAELNDEQVNFNNLSTYDILQRARYWMDRGDFAQTLRYMNLLGGASRSVAAQWMNEARILLETQQAANTLMAHAAANGLSFL